MPRDYGEMMAEAAGDGFDSPEAAASARYRSRYEEYEPDDRDSPDAQPHATPAAETPLHQVALPG